MGTRLDTIPGDVPYLAALDQLEQQWREPLSRLSGLRVGVCFQSDLGAGDADRSIPPQLAARLAAVPGVTLVSLHRRDFRQALAAVEDRFAMADLGDELDTRHGAWMDTAAIIKSLDLVVSCDATVAHLAGGLAMPVWIAVSAATQWRWMSDRTDSPWYPSARLFRQARLGAWSDVVTRIADELATVAASRR